MWYCCNSCQSVSVWLCTPSRPLITKMAASNTCKVRSVSAEKSTCPGVSSKVMVFSGRGRMACLEKMVIPRSRSSGLVSRKASLWSTLPFHYTAIFGKNLYANVQVATWFYNLYIFFVRITKTRPRFLCRITLFYEIHFYKKYFNNRCGKRAAGNQKVFRCSSFSKMLPRCGRVAHVCEANYICSMLAGKSRGGTPFCRTMKIVFSKNYSLHLFHWSRCNFYAVFLWKRTVQK